MKQGTIRIVVLLVVVALVLGGVGVAIVGLTSGGSGGSGGSSEDGAAREVPAPTTTPEAGAQDPPRPALAPFYDQELEWAACGDQECSRITVPLDYADPDGETIEIAVLRVPARVPEERIGSLVVNPGGPGAPGTTYASQAGGLFGQPLLDRFDIVGFDPRGTGFSTPVDCVSDEQLDVFRAADPAPDDQEEADALEQAQRAFNAGCAAESGDLANHVTTVEAARDMDVLRAALGESRLTYFGASYGTKLGATYAELFPDRSGRLVLDGAVDLSLSSRELSLGQAAGFETAIRAYVKDCVANGDCPLGDSVEAGLQRLKDFLDEVDARPLPAGDRELEVGNAFYGIVAPLYNREYWFLLTRALAAAFEGNGAPLLQLSDAYASRGPDGYLDNSSEAIAVINCLDDPTAVDPDDIPGQVAAFEEVSPTFGEVFAWGLAGCLGVRTKATVETPDVDASGAPPILVIGTTRDPATPYEWAEALADQLEPAVLLTRDGDGHTGYQAGNACVDEIVEDYLIDGTVPEDGTRC
ncbi:alpha/beta hydrolase [Nocardioides marmotae]|uniref:alpha/beta hydrolase n=1 Tax=Nocardioides marmotae TaxID=2663857 RepID=UPI002934F605|nr:alpha/beta hydrolase [Nocardioides marmotae]